MSWPFKTRGSKEAAPEPQPAAPTPIVALTPEEIAAFWGGSPLRIFTAKYLEALCAKNNLVLINPEE